MPRSSLSRPGRGQGEGPVISPPSPPPSPSSQRERASITEQARDRPRTLVQALASIASRFTPDARREKLRLLERLEALRIAGPAPLLRLHESLCFLQAYPDDAPVLAAVERALERFPARVSRLPGASLARLRDTGISGTTLEYPFGLPIARWLVSRFPRDVAVAWRGFGEGERLEETLAILVSHAENEAFTEGGLGWRRWLRAARAGRRVTDARLLVELFDRAALPAEARDLLFEGLGLSFRWRLGSRHGSRTGARLPDQPASFQRRPLRREGLDFGREVRQPLPSLQAAPRGLANALIHSARVATATRLRELYAFDHPNPEDVLVADPGRGLRIALVGLLPRFRLPLDAYYAFLALRNGVPVSYGAGWCIFGTLEMAFNIFESFRQGESPFICSQVLRAYRQATGALVVVIDPYQIGHHNLEALRSGAFYFYHRLGFRPRDPAVLRLSEEEQKKIAQDRAYRSPLPVLRQLARSEMFLSLGGNDREPPGRVSAARVAAAVTRHIARSFGGDRSAATREATARAGRLLGARRWREWPAAERRAFERLSLVAAVIRDLERWPAAERGALARIFRAKGGRSEVAFVRLLDRHRRFRQCLEAITRSARLREPRAPPKAGEPDSRTRRPRRRSE